MATQGQTELNATIDERWDMEVEPARYAAAVMLPRINNRSSVAKGHGDIVNVTVGAKMYAGDVTAASGAFTPQAYTNTSVALTIDQWKYVSFETTERALAQSFWDPESQFPRDAGKVLGETIDTAIGTLFTGASSSVGDPNAPSAFDLTMINGAMLKLAQAKIPKEDLSFILDPIAIYGGYLKDSQFTAANQVGLPKSVLTTNFRTTLLGVPVYETPLITAVGTALPCVLIHKSAIAVAVQKNNEWRRYDKSPAGYLAYGVVMQGLY
jgi:hypothetical protein